MVESRKTARHFAVRLALFFGALFIIYGMHVPFMPVWLHTRGLTPGEISAVMAAPFFLRLFITPAVALAADRAHAHRAFLIGLAWISLAIVLLLAFADSFWPIFILAVALVVANSTIMPLTETLAVSGVRNAGLDYGRMRLWGSLTFVAASFAGGVAVTKYGGGAGVWLVAIGCVATVIAAHLLPHMTSNAPQVAARVPFAIWRAAEPRALIALKEYRTFLIAAGLVQAAHATFLTFGTLLWQEQGLSGTWIGTLWAIGVFAEVALFAASGAVVRALGVGNILLAGAVVSIARWTAMALEPNLAMLVPLQLLHGVTYGATHLAAIHFMHEAVPRHATGIAQALYATVAAGIAMGAATLIAGWLYAPGGGLAYAAMAVVSCAATLAALHLKSIWSGGLILPEAAVADAPDTAVPIEIELAPEPRIGG